MCLTKNRNVRETDLPCLTCLNLLEKSAPVIGQAGHWRELEQFAYSLMSMFIFSKGDEQALHARLGRVVKK